MTVRHAACTCGQLTVACEGEPLRVSLCHCLDCRRRTGSAFGTQARFRADQVRTGGRSADYVRTADSGRTITQRFCPDCGSTVWWTLEREPGVVAVAVGAFADPGFPAPWVEVYRARRSPWTEMPALAGIERHD
ncbi:MAG TPA: GFA family protein [Lysobacter sp.]|nr:GFA family protein [Lysobacter sp.]